jgi:hypothetical protein
MSRGFSDQIAERVLAAFVGPQDATSSIVQPLIRGILSKLPANALEPFWSALLNLLASHADGSRVLERLLSGEDLLRDSSLRLLFTSKFVVSKVFPYQMLHHLIKFLHQQLGSDKLFAEVVSPAASVWGDTHFLRKAPESLQQCVLLLLLRFT